MALSKASPRTRGLRVRHPLKQRTQLLRSARLIFVRMLLIVSAYASPRFSLILVASCFITLDAADSAPPEPAKTSALKLLCLVSWIHSSYLFCLMLSWYLYVSFMVLGQLFALGLKIFASKQVRLKRQTFSLMSSWASSSVVVELLGKISPLSDWSFGLSGHRGKRHPSGLQTRLWFRCVVGVYTRLLRNVGHEWG